SQTQCCSGAVPTSSSAGTWRLVRTPNPRGGPDAVSIMQTADAARSDIDLAGLTLRCSDTGFDVIVVFLKPFPPRTHPKVKLTTGSYRRILVTEGVRRQRVELAI